MHTITMEGALKDLRDLLDDEPGYYFSWKGRMFNETYKYPRVDNISLDVIYKDEEVYRYRRSFVCSTPKGRSQVLFTGKDTYRVTNVNSHRYSRNFMEEDLPLWEERLRCGLSKELTVMNGGGGFSKKKKIDVDSVFSLHKAVLAESVESLDRFFPEIYLTLPGEGAEDMLRFRNSDSRRELEKLPDCDGSVQSAIEAVAINVGGGRIGVPYEHFLGSGVLCADYKQPVFGRWYFTPELNIETAQFAIRHF